MSVCSLLGGGVPCLRFSGGVPGLRFSGGGPRSQIFWGGSQVSDFGGGPRSHIFGGGSQVSDFLGGYPVSVKGKIFDTRFGLIHVQTGKKKFCRGTPPPPRNSKKLLWPRGGRYASCVHAGGLSCINIVINIVSSPVVTVTLLELLL